MFADSISYSDLHLCGFVMTELMKLGKIVVVMHEADHALH